MNHHKYVLMSAHEYGVIIDQEYYKIDHENDVQ